MDSFKWNPKCAVTACGKKGLQTFQMPKDRHLRLKWILASKNSKLDVKKLTFHRFCSRHFSNECFSRNLKQELMEPTKNRSKVLKPDAVPTLYLSEESDQDDGDVSNVSATKPVLKKKVNDQNRREIVEQAMKEYEQSQTEELYQKLQQEEAELNQLLAAKIDSVLVKNERIINVTKPTEKTRKKERIKNVVPTARDDSSALARSVEIIRHLRPVDFCKGPQDVATVVITEATAKKVPNSTDELPRVSPMQVYVKTEAPYQLPKQLCIKQLKTSSKKVQCSLDDGKLKLYQHLTKEVEHQKKLVTELKQKLKQTKMSLNTFNSKTGRSEIVRQELSKAAKMSASQVNCLLNRNIRVKNWEIREIILPIIQMSYSHRAYVFAQKTSLLPMPSLSTLKQWQVKLRQDPGLLQQALQIIDEDSMFDPSEVRIKFVKAIKIDARHELLRDDSDDDDFDFGIAVEDMKSQALALDLI